MSLQPTLPLEVTIEQSIQELYLVLFNHSLAKVTCSHLADNIVAIVLDDATTLPERALIQGDRLTTAKALRYHLNLIFERCLKVVLNDAYGCVVDDILSRHQADTGCISLIVVMKCHRGLAGK